MTVKIPGASPGAFDKTSANLIEPHAIHTTSRSADQAEASFGVSDPQRMKLLRSTPLRPLAERMRELASSCAQFDVATAFVSESAVKNILGPALDSGAAVRFLTGTFGATTRKATFEALLRRGTKHPLATRIWSCQTHENFHAKLYLWQFRDGRGIAWVGSANFTDGGLRSEGELIVEFSGRCDDPELRRLRKGFEHDWKRGDPLSKKFIGDYEQAERKPPDFIAQRERGRTANRQTAAHVGGMFVTYVDQHFSEDSPTCRRIDELFEGTADFWLRHFVKSLSKLRQGQRGLIVDTVDQDVSLVEVTDRKRDGKAFVFSYIPVFKRPASQPWNHFTRKSLSAAGWGPKVKRARTCWVSADLGKSLAKALYPRRTKNW